LSLTFNSYLQKNPISLEQQSIFSVLNFKAPFFEDENRAPIDLVAVVDVSGSMRNDLPLVVETLFFMVTQLTSKDRFSLVSFGSDVKTIFQLTYMDENGKKDANHLIKKKLKINGSTFLSGGLLEGVNIIRSRQTPFNDVASVLLFTDGKANLGITDPEKIVEEVSIFRNENNNLTDTPFTIFTFGYQQNHNAELLRRIAEYSKSGVYFFIENKDAIAQCFADCLGGLLSVVAQNINITVRACGENEVTILSDLQKIESVPHKEIAIKFGDIQSEESKDIVCEIKVPVIENPSEIYDLIEWHIEYFNVLNLNQRSEVIKITTNRQVAPVSENDSYVDMQYNRILVAKALKEADSSRQSGNNQQAKKILLDTIQLLEKSPSAQTPFTQQLIKDLTQAAQELETQSETSTYTMQNLSDKHSKQRSNYSNDTTYITGKKNKKKMEYMFYKDNN